MSSFNHLYRLEARPASLVSVVGPYAVTAITAVAIFMLAYDGGSYDAVSRNTLGVAIWWTIMLAVALGVWPLARPTRAAFATGGLLAVLAAFALLSIAWATSSEDAFAEFNRIALYVGVFTLVVLASTRANASRWSDGLALGITSVGILALASRFFPDLFAEREVTTFLPSAATRLSFPVDYWNGLAILVALALPLLLRGAVAWGPAVARGAAVAPLPALAAVVYLTSSRTGVATVVVGTLAFFTLTARRWAAGTAIALAALGSAAAVAVLQNRHELVNGPLDSAVAASQGESAAFLIAVVCALTGLVYALGCALFAGRREPPTVLGAGLLAVAAVAAIVGILMLDPVERFEQFKNPSATLVDTRGDYVRAHLLSASGNGRWQLWGSSVDQFRSEPLHGGGAGSYEAWWAKNGSLPMFVRDAHSLYAETLGELGLVGFVLLLAAFGAGIAAALWRLRAQQAEGRVTLAAFTASFIAFVVAAGVDWMWELTIVSMVAVACLALATGPATAPPPSLRPLQPGETAEPKPRNLFGVGVSVLLAGWLLICSHALPLLAASKIRDSQEAVQRGDGDAAISNALAARTVEPWAASPYLQLALVAEQAGRLQQARAWIRAAIERDRTDWRLWVVSSRIETRLGRIEAARASLARARDLNQRSGLLASE